MATIELVCAACRATRSLVDPRSGSAPTCACGGRLALPGPAVFACLACGVRSKPAKIDLATVRPCPRCKDPLVVVEVRTESAREPTLATRAPRPASEAATLLLADAAAAGGEIGFVGWKGEPVTPTVTLATRHGPVVPGAGSLAPDASFGRYRIVRELARGGMGIVYEAEDPALRRTVALKVLIAGEGASSEAIARFAREARAAGQLRHPHIVAVHDAGEIDGQHYFTMDFIRGQELSPAAAKVELAQALRWMHSICLALHHAHENGIVHRDLKPGNIMIDGDGRPVVMDFGLAKDVNTDSFRSLSGAIFGTPAYMSPEQAQGRTREIDRRTDVYALGVILYELATGKRPFGGDTLFDTMRAVVSDDPRPPIAVRPGLSRDLDTIILRCLEKRPQHRYATAQALAEELERHLDGEDIQARPLAAHERLWRHLRRRPALLAGAAAGVLALVIGATMAVLLLGDGFVDRMAGEIASGDPGRTRAATTTLAGQLGDGALSEEDAGRARDLLRGLIGGVDAEAEGTAIAALAAARDAATAPALTALATDATKPTPRRIAAAQALTALGDAVTDREATARALAAAVVAEREQADLVGALATAAAMLATEVTGEALAPAAEDATRPTAVRLAMVRALPGSAPLNGPVMRLLLRLSGDRDAAVGDAAVARLAELRMREPVFALYGLERPAAQAVAGLAGIQATIARQTREAEELLGESADPPAARDPAEAMAARLGQGSREDRLAAVVDLAGLAAPSAVRPLTSALTDDDGAIRRAAGRALVRLAARVPVDSAAITPLLAHTDAGVRTDAAATLGDLEAREAIPALGAALASERDLPARLAAIAALGRIGDAEGLPALRACASAAGADRDGGEIARACLAAFAQRRAFAGAALPDLVGALDHASRAMRDAAAIALAEATGERFGTDAPAWRTWLAAQAKP